jgi:hypothetical protein
LPKNVSYYEDDVIGAFKIYFFDNAEVDSILSHKPDDLSFNHDTLVDVFSSDHNTLVSVFSSGHYDGFNDV